VVVRAQDTFGASSIERFTVSVFPASGAPLILSQWPTTVVIEGQVFSYPVVAIDPDGDTLTYDLSIASDPPGSTRQSNTPDDNVVSWTTTAGDAGSYTATVTVSDGTLTATQASPLLVVAPAAIGNNPPTLSASMPVPARAGQVYRARVSASDPDVDPPDTLEFRLDRGPEGMTIDAVSGELEWLNPVDTGLPHEIVVSVHDGRGGWAKFDPPFLLPVNSNRPPVVATRSLPGPGTVGVTYQTTIEASDPDGDTIQFSLTGIVDAAGEQVATDTDGDGTPDITLDANSGVFRWDAPAEAGIYTVLVRVADTRQGDIVPAEVNVSYPLEVRAVPTNRAPVIDADEQYPVSTRLLRPSAIRTKSASWPPTPTAIRLPSIMRSAIPTITTMSYRPIRTAMDRTRSRSTRIRVSSCGTLPKLLVRTPSTSE
jgi:hypothetical protein